MLNINYAMHKLFRQYDIPNINGINKKWSNLLITKPGYTTTNSGDKEYKVRIFYRKLYKFIYVGTDCFHSPLHCGDSIRLAI